MGKLNNSMKIDRITINSIDPVTIEKFKGKPRVAIISNKVLFRKKYRHLKYIAQSARCRSLYTQYNYVLAEKDAIENDIPVIHYGYPKYNSVLIK